MCLFEWYIWICVFSVFVRVFVKGKEENSMPGLTEQRGGYVVVVEDIIYIGWQGTV